MTTQLEPIFLANVLLYTDSLETVTSCAQMSSHGNTAREILKTNPHFTSKLPVAATLTLFPNINTLFVDSLAVFKTVPDLPESVSRVVVDRFGPDSSTAPSPLLHRIVEIRQVRWYFLITHSSGCRSISCHWTTCTRSPHARVSSWWCLWVALRSTFRSNTPSLTPTFSSSLPSCATACNTTYTSLGHQHTSSCPGGLTRAHFVTFMTKPCSIPRWCFPHDWTTTFPVIFPF